MKKILNIKIMNNIQMFDLIRVLFFIYDESKFA